MTDEPNEPLTAAQKRESLIKEIGCDLDKWWDREMRKGLEVVRDDGGAGGLLASAMVMAEAIVRRIELGRSGQPALPHQIEPEPDAEEIVVASQRPNHKLIDSGNGSVIAYVTCWQLPGRALVQIFDVSTNSSTWEINRR